MVSLLPMTARGALTRRKGRVLVGPVDLDLAAGGLTVVIGPNGAGKTSLLRLLHGLARLGGGEVSWACPLEEARKRQAFVFQKPVMLRRSVRENIAYPLKVAGARGAPARVAEMAARVGLGEMMDRPAAQLSGGEAQKLALARALVTDPELLFLDEPTTSLDGRATREVEAILAEAKAGGVTILMATHDMGQARRLADRVWFMAGGQLVEDAGAASFFEGPSRPQAQAFLAGDIVE